ncbi:MAG: OB-fold domain-containing protein [Halieaceae bacterium]|nr:OB-fold domain-containing protein [Halieaceae bacterium]
MPTKRLDKSSDAMFQPYYDAAAEQRFVLPQCGSCGHRFWYPQTSCPSCLSLEWTWRDTKPQGRIFSWTEVHHPFNEELTETVPFLVVIVEPDEAPGVHLVSSVRGIEPGELRVGLPVVATFAAPVWSDHMLPVFEIDPARV